MYPTYIYFKGLYSLKSFMMGFWYFCLKNGSKTPINGPKMSWFGMVWFGLARLGQYKMVWTENKNLTFNLAILDNLNIVLGSAMTRDHNLAKSNHTKPNQDILGPFIGLFDPFFGEKYQKPIVKDFRECSPLKYIYLRYIFHWSRFWGNSLDLVTLLTTCADS